jgi:hypothetical protein
MARNSRLDTFNFQIKLFIHLNANTFTVVVLEIVEDIKKKHVGKNSKINTWGKQIFQDKYLGEIDISR